MNLKKTISILVICMLIVSVGLLYCMYCTAEEGGAATGAEGAATTASGSGGWMVWVWLAVILVAFISF